jgi:hypothetical protein
MTLKNTQKLRNNCFFFLKIPDLLDVNLGRRLLALGPLEHHPPDHRRLSPGLSCSHPARTLLPTRCFRRLHSTFQVCSSLLDHCQMFITYNFLGLLDNSYRFIIFVVVGCSYLIAYVRRSYEVFLCLIM